MSEHIIKGVSQLISNLLNLELLSVDLVLDVVNPLVELGDVHLAVLEPALGHLVLLLDLQDFVLQLLPVDLVLDVVNPLVQLGDVHLPILIPEQSDSI